MNMRNRDWLAIAMLLGLGVIGAQAEIRNDWEFNDVVGTFIQDATNSGTQMATFTAINDFFLSTDGSGALVDSTFGNTFTTADIFDITSGTAYLRIDFDSWNFDTNTVSANENVSIGFRDNVAGSNIVLARAVRNTNDTVRLVALAWNPSTVFTTVDTFSAENFTAGVDVVLALTVGGTYDLYYRTGTEPFALGASGAYNSSLTIDRIRYQSQNNLNGPGEFIATDRIFQGESLEEMGVSGVLNDWQFDDPIGTEVGPSLVNSGTEGASFSGDSPGWATDGAGRLVDTSSTNHFKTANIADATAGSVYLRMDVAAWNFTTNSPADSEKISFGFRDASESNNLVLARIARTTNDTVAVRVVDDSGVSNVASFALSDTGGVDIVLEVGLDDDTYDVWYRTGATPFVVGASGAINTSNTADLIRFHSEGTLSDPGEFISVDRLFQGKTLSDVGVTLDVPFTEIIALDTVEIIFDAQAGIEFQREDSADLPAGFGPSGMSVVGNGGTMRVYDQADSTSTSYRVIGVNPSP